MSKVSRTAFTSLLAITCASIVYGAVASENDAMAINSAKIPLTQAINAAEQHLHGKASRAEFEKTRQGWLYDVEVVAGGKVYDVKVDADKGTVTAATEDKGDHDDEHDKD